MQEWKDWHTEIFFFRFLDLEFSSLGRVMDFAIRIYNWRGAWKDTISSRWCTSNTNSGNSFITKTIIYSRNIKTIIINKLYIFIDKLLNCKWNFKNILKIIILSIIYDCLSVSSFDYSYLKCYHPVVPYFRLRFIILKSSYTLF